MKRGVALLRWVAVVCTSLSLTACGGDMTAGEPPVVEAEAEALASQEAAVSSCGTWSAWYPTGNTQCRPRASCGIYGYCVPSDSFPQDESCPPGQARIYDTHSTQEEWASYRVCFDQYGNYSHTEYQYRYYFMYCGGC
ncbi:MAG TPA: hypothetical protein VE153_31990 [Myxococcus sp.]|nr:hypothetical protein [Myxococcus sp.]